MRYVPVVHFGQLPLANHNRWNLGGGLAIIPQDVNALGAPLTPPMFFGQLAFGNTTLGIAGTCPAD